MRCNMKLHILIWKYICQYKYTAIVFIIFTLIFAGIFSLYNLETEAVLYAAILCLFISSVLIIFHFYNFCKQHKKRHMILSNILIMTENLPEPKSGNDRKAKKHKPCKCNKIYK